MVLIKRKDWDNINLHVGGLAKPAETSNRTPVGLAE